DTCWGCHYCVSAQLMPRHLPTRRCFNCTLRNTWCSMRWRVSTQRMPSAYHAEDASIAHCATLGAALSGVCQHSECHLPTRRCFNCTLRNTWCSMEWRVSTQRMPSAYQKMLQLHTAQHLVQHAVACVNTANGICLPEDASIA